MLGDNQFRRCVWLGFLGRPDAPRPHGGQGDRDCHRGEAESEGKNESPHGRFLWGWLECQAGCAIPRGPCWRATDSTTAIVPLALASGYRGGLGRLGPRCSMIVLPSSTERIAKNQETATCCHRIIMDVHQLIFSVGTNTPNHSNPSWQFLRHLDRCRNTLGNAVPLSIMMWPRHLPTLAAEKRSDSRVWNRQHPCVKRPDTKSARENTDRFLTRHDDCNAWGGRESTCRMLLLSEFLPSELVT